MQTTIDNIMRHYERRQSIIYLWPGSIVTSASEFEWWCNHVFWFGFVSQQDLPVGGTVIRDIEAKDADAGINALVEYKVLPNAQRMRSGSANSSSASSLFDGALDASDGFGTFEFPSAHIPVLTLRQPVDYELVRRYLVTIVASVKPIISFAKQRIGFQFFTRLTRSTLDLNVNIRIERSTSKIAYHRPPL